MEQLNKYPTFCNYLVFVLAKLTNQGAHKKRPKNLLFFDSDVIFLLLDEATRSLSGLILKNNIRMFWDSYPDDVRQYVRQECLQAIGDQSPLIRATVGIIITNTVCKEGLNKWPTLLDSLCHMIDSQDYNTCEVRQKNCFESRQN